MIQLRGMSKYAVVAKDIHKSYGKLKVLTGINLSVERGTIFALLGPNGAGKTTMVRILTTLLKANKGTATVGGFNIATQADKVRSVIGLTGQYAAVDEYLNGYENLVVMGRLYRLKPPVAKKRAGELLQQFDLVDAAKRQVKTYSGGMRRRLDLAASLIANPPIIFLDEPTTGLDPRSRNAMWAVIQNLASTGATILLTTQYLQEADHLANKIMVIDHGVVIAEGTAEQLKNRVGKERIEFVLPTLDAYKKAALLLGKTAQRDVKRRTVSIANEDGVTYMKNLLIKFERARVPIESLSLHKPTLDDVFLELTGKQATIEESEEAP